jgi:hypothetical protein
VIDATILAEAVALILAAGVVFALSIRVGMLLGRRMDRALEAHQAADGSLPSDETPDAVEEVRVDD